MLLSPLLMLQAGAVNVRVSASQVTGTVSRYVYGTNEDDWYGSGRYLVGGRLGGNRWTAYNWENNASNAGSDYYNQNDGYLGGGDVPGEAVRSHLEVALPAGRGMVVTVPMAGYVSADKNGGGDVNATPNYLTTRFRRVVPRKGAAFVYPPNPGDANVYVDEFVSWLESRFPNRNANQRIFYSLDNEPDLWRYTHSRIHPDAATYAEMVQKTTDTASAIKAVAPNATVFGFVSYGYYGYRTLQDAPDGNGRDFIDFYLDAMRNADGAAGKRLLDVLDLHWYPEAQGNGQRITGNDVSAASVQARVQAPRSLWDPNYTETSWITQYATNGPIKLIPTLRGQIAAHYPGTGLAFTEYNYGASNHISGAIAQADALGIFGREGVFAADFWPLQADNSYVHAAFDAFRNYDGLGDKFGDQELLATTSNVADVTAYASKGANGPGVRIVLINKTTVAKPVMLALDFVPASMRSYSLTGAQAKMVASSLGTLRGRAANLTLPALSVNTIVLE